MNVLKSKSSSHKALLLIIPILVFSGLNFKNWNNHYIISQDVAIYYGYLPATFIYNDLSFKFLEDLPDNFEGNIVYSNPPGSNAKILKMTMGVAILHLPFFLFMHVLTHLILPFDANGYTPPYEFAFYLSTIFYVLLGLFFVRKILLKRFSEKITASTLILILFGTNLFFYTTMRAGTSHVFSFSLFAIAFFLFEKWHNKPSWATTVLIGVVSGMIILVRPTNAIIAVVFILFGIINKQSLHAKFRLLVRNYQMILAMVLIAFIVFLPQMFYWHHITGDWIYYSYKDEGFFFHDPEILKGLFSFRKGWLVYTPLMIFALLGIPLLYKHCKEYLTPIIVFTLLNIFIIYSWWTWWYGGSFGSRPMIDSYGLLAIPFSVFLKELNRKSKWLRISIYSIFTLFIMLNIWQSKQYKRGVIHYDGMTKDAYFELFFSYHRPKTYNKLIDRPDYFAAKKNIDRTLSYYKENLNPAQKKIYNMAINSSRLRKEFKMILVTDANNYSEKLKKVLINPKSHPKAYTMIIDFVKTNIRNSIINTKQWYNKIKRIANEKNEPVDTVLQRHVNYVFQIDYQKKLDEYKQR